MDPQNDAAKPHTDPKHKQAAAMLTDPLMHLPPQGRTDQQSHCHRSLVHCQDILHQSLPLVY